MVLCLCFPYLTCAVGCAYAYGVEDSLGSLRLFTLVGQTFLTLTPELAAAAPSDEIKAKVLAPAGPRLRVGPFPPSAEGLGAAVEWLHAGALTAIWDVLVAPETVELVGRVMGKEHPRTRLVARLNLTMHTQPLAEGSPEAQEIIDGVVATVTELKPIVGGVQVCFDPPLLPMRVSCAFVGLT